MAAVTPVLSDSNDSIIRIKAGKVVQLMDMIGELSLAADEIMHHPKFQTQELDELQNATNKLNQLIRELQDHTSSMRLVTIDAVFKRMQRLARDLSKQTHKDFTFTLSGEETEIDKVVVDTLSDPLVHIIRNCVDHGMESPEQRSAANKSPKGHIHLSAKQESGEIVITIEDDGAGLNKQKILSRAIEKGIIPKNHTLDEASIWQLIFEPGFSTKEAVSSLSGRGVGMDVVKTTMEYLRGHIDIQSTLNQGTKIQLTIPLNLAFLNTMVVSSHQSLFAIAIENILEIFQADEDAIKVSSAGQFEALQLREQLIPICSFSAIHNNSLDNAPALNTTEHKPDPQQASIYIILNTHGQAIALPVTQVLGQFQVSIKPLTGYLKQIRAVSGCALLPSGDIAWVLDTQYFSLQHSLDPNAPREQKDDPTLENTQNVFPEP